MAYELKLQPKSALVIWTVALVEWITRLMAYGLVWGAVPLKKTVLGIISPLQRVHPQAGSIKVP